MSVQKVEIGYNFPSTLAEAWASVEHDGLMALEFLRGHHVRRVDFPFIVEVPDMGDATKMDCLRSLLCEAGGGMPITFRQGPCFWG